MKRIEHKGSFIKGVNRTVDWVNIFVNFSIFTLKTAAIFTGLSVVSSILGIVIFFVNGTSYSNFIFNTYTAAMIMLFGGYILEDLLLFKDCYFINKKLKEEDFDCLNLEDNWVIPREYITLSIDKSTNVPHNEVTKGTYMLISNKVNYRVFREYRVNHKLVIEELDPIEDEEILRYDLADSYLERLGIKCREDEGATSDVLDDVVLEENDPEEVIDFHQTKTIKKLGLTYPKL